MDSAEEKVVAKEEGLVEDRTEVLGDVAERAQKEEGTEDGEEKVAPSGAKEAKMEEVESPDLVEEEMEAEERVATEVDWEE